MISNHRIALDGDRARAIAAFRSSHLDKGNENEHPAHSHEGWYLGDLTRTADGWRFARLKRVNLAEVLTTSPKGAAAEEIYRSVGWVKEPWSPSR
jgi:SnoaL-like protein